MADTLSANAKRGASAGARTAAATVFVLPAERLTQLGAGRYLIVAAAIQAIALTVSLASGAEPLHLLLTTLGLGLILIALALPERRNATAHVTHFVAQHVPSAAAEPASSEPTPSAAAETELPAAAPAINPLPFLGERILADVNERNIENLRRAAERLAYMNTARKHPWTELMARVSHELRTPLNAVIGFSDVMNAELLGPVGHPRYREYARHIRDCGRELLKSAEDTLAITCLLDINPQHTPEEPLNLYAAIADAWHFFAADASLRNITLEQNVSDEILLMMQRRPMRQTLINLLAEAIHRAEDGGTIGIGALAHGDIVQIEISVKGRPNSHSIGEASLAICLARALLELQGASLIEVDDPSSTWRALTILRCAAAQEDFFSTHYPELDGARARLC